MESNGLCEEFSFAKMPKNKLSKTNMHIIQAVIFFITGIFYRLLNKFYEDNGVEEAKKDDQNNQADKRKIRILCKKIVESRIFESFIIVMIIISSAVLVKHKNLQYLFQNFILFYI